MIDHENKLIFIHLEKCGGTSIEEIFTNKDWWYKINDWLLLSDNSNGNEKHVKYSLTKIIYKEYFDKYKKFCIVRNPYTLFKSKFFWINSNKIKNENITKITKQHVINMIKDNKKRWEINTLYDFVGPKKNYDFVISFENYKDDYSKMLKEFNLDEKKFPLVHVYNSKSFKMYEPLRLTYDAKELIKEYSKEYCKEYGYILE